MQHFRPSTGDPHLDRLKPVIIGFCGKAGAGKTTAATHLIADHRFARIRFADLFKRMLTTLIMGQGADMATALRMVDGDFKETPTAYLAGRTPRHAMQTLGQEWGRDLIGSEFWVGAWRNAVQTAIVRGAGARPVHPVCIVADDVRYPNEVDVIRQFGGRVIRIDRPGMEVVAGGHISESHELKADWTITNDGDEDLLRRNLDRLFPAR